MPARLSNRGYQRAGRQRAGPGYTTLTADMRLRKDAGLRRWFGKPPACLDLAKRPSSRRQRVEREPQQLNLLNNHHNTIKQSIIALRKQLIRRRDALWCDVRLHELHEIAEQKIVFTLAATYLASTNPTHI
jgi:hypothetical protein